MIDSTNDIKDREAINERNQEIVKEFFLDFLNKKNLRKTPERLAILKEIYLLDEHFEVETLHRQMNLNSYSVSIATVYNTIDLLLECALIRKHQFGSKQNFYEKSYFNNQHDHVILTDTGEIKEFCDPRIDQIKDTLETIFDIQIHDRALYFYATKKTN